MTAPTRGKAARGRQGGMVIVKAGQARRMSRSLLFYNCADRDRATIRHGPSFEGDIWESQGRSPKGQSRPHACVWQIRSHRSQQTSSTSQTSASQCDRLGQLVLSHTTHGSIKLEWTSYTRTPFGWGFKTTTRDLANNPSPRCTTSTSKSYIPSVRYTTDTRIP